MKAIKRLVLSFLVVLAMIFTTATVNGEVFHDHDHDDYLQLANVVEAKSKKKTKKKTSKKTKKKTSKKTKKKTSKKTAKKTSKKTTKKKTTKKKTVKKTTKKKTTSKKTTAKKTTAKKVVKKVTYKTVKVKQKVKVRYKSKGKWKTKYVWKTVTKKVKVTQSVPVHVHTYVTVNGYPATCTSNGLTNGVKCSGCGAWQTGQSVIPALGHHYTYRGMAWNGASANAVFTCDRCGDTYYRAARVSVKVQRSASSSTPGWARYYATYESYSSFRDENFGAADGSNVSMTRLGFEARDAGRINTGRNTGYHVNEGSCTDGTYVYFVEYDNSRHRSVIVKVNLHNYNDVRTSGEMDLGHGNDMTYDSKRQRLVVAVNEDDTGANKAAYRKRVIYLDTNFGYKGSAELDLNPDSYKIVTKKTRTVYDEVEVPVEDETDGSKENAESADKANTDTKTTETNAETNKESETTKEVADSKETSTNTTDKTNASETNEKTSGTEETTEETETPVKKTKTIKVPREEEYEEISYSVNLTGISGICGLGYSAGKDKYVVQIKGDSGDFLLVNPDNMKIEKRIRVNNPYYSGTGYTNQGMDVSDNYIFKVQSVSNHSVSYNIVTVWDYDGNLKATYKALPDRYATSGYEIETVFHVGSTFYFTYYSKEPSNGTGLTFAETNVFRQYL